LYYLLLRGVCKGKCPSYTYFIIQPSESEKNIKIREKTNEVKPLSHEGIKIKMISAAPLPLSIFTVLLLALRSVLGSEDDSVEETETKASQWNYLIIMATVFIGYLTVNGMLLYPFKIAAQEQEEEEEEDPIVLRNFTLEQLHKFHGREDENTGQETPVYLSLEGTVFDVSNGRDFYGPGGPYEAFAGHEVGASLGKMSFDSSFIDDLGACSSLNFGEREELENWIVKFRDYRHYPILGQLVHPAPGGNDAIVSAEELRTADGTQGCPEGYATPPIYVAMSNRVYDVSFGGVEFYGVGRGYEKFAGRDVSRALAKMSFDPSDLENTDTSDLSESQIKVLNDWIKTFEEKKGYPCAGVLKK